MRAKDFIHVELSAIYDAHIAMHTAINTLVNSKTVFLKSDDIKESRKLYKQLRDALDKANGVKP